MSILLYIVNGFIILGLIYLLFKTSRSSPLSIFFSPALGLKLLSGLLLGLVFIHYYDGVGDTLNYFREAKRYADLARLDFWSYIQSMVNNSVEIKSIYHSQPRALLFTKITSVLALLTNDNYWISSIYFTLFSFSGIWALATRLTTIVDNKAGIAISLFFFPSVVFWSTGVTKESLAIGALMLLISSFLGYMFKQRRITVWLLALDLFYFVILWHIKYYYAGAFILVMTSALIVLYLSSKNARLRASFKYQIGVFLIIGSIVALAVSFTSPNFNLGRLAHVVALNHDAFVKKSEPANVIQYSNLEGNWQSLLFNAPKAIFSGLFRPLPGDGSGWLSGLVKAENLVIILLMLTTFFSIKTLRSVESRLVLLAGVFYCLLLATFLALSAPNFGTLVRYKIGFMPVFLLLITLDNPLIKKLNHWLFAE